VKNIITLVKYTFMVLLLTGSFSFIEVHSSVKEKAAKIEADTKKHKHDKGGAKGDEPANDANKDKHKHDKGGAKGDEPAGGPGKDGHKHEKGGAKGDEPANDASKDKHKHEKGGAKGEGDEDDADTKAGAAKPKGRG